MGFSGVSIFEALLTSSVEQVEADPPKMDCSSYQYQMDYTTTCIGKAVPQLQTPAFLVDLKKATKNCQAMKDSCKSLGLAFRPLQVHIEHRKVLNSRQWNHRNVSCVGVYMKSSILPIMVLMTFFMASPLLSKTFPGLRK